MKQQIITYKTKPDQAALNTELLRDIFDELRTVDPPNVRWEAFLLDDGVSFVHVVVYEGENPIPELDSFKRYTAELRERQESEPVFGEATAIGSFGERPLLRTPER